MASAVTILLGYLGLCWLCWYRYRRQQRAAADASMVDECLVVYASQTGYAATLALQTARFLGLKEPLSMQQVTPEQLQRARRALFVVSTCGEGEAPDMARGFIRRFLPQTGFQAEPISSEVTNAEVQTLPSAFAHLEYAVLALGDRQYQRFCQFGRDLYQGLKRQGAQPLFAPIEVDGRDDAALEQWQSQVRGLVPDSFPSTARSINHEKPDYLGAVLRQRECLNPGSPGAPIYRVSLDSTELPRWQAGDILTVAVPTEESGQQTLVERDYSIASVPEEGELQLLVRQVHHSPEQLGIGSGWLTRRAPVSAPLLCRLRSNPGFHSPPPQADLILIGAGSGMAGLRGHLAARAGAGGAGRSWLLFGERSPQQDSLLVDELQQWQAAGVLYRTDLAFSRCIRQPRYVQQLLVEQKERLRAWLAAGAYLYLCGSRSGMGDAVQETLKALLGEQHLEQLLIDNRYRRDLY